MVNGSGAPSGMVPQSAFVDGESAELACADTGSGDMAFWMYSSGSTGRPKGIVHLHHDMAYTHQSFGSHVLRLGADDRCFSVPKIFFAYGFGNSLTFPFSVGATTVLMSGRRMTLRAVVRLGDCVEESDATRALLQQFVKDRLLPFKYPRIVEFVADLPKTGTGKIDRQALRESESGQKR